MKPRWRQELRQHWGGTQHALRGGKGHGGKSTPFSGGAPGGGGHGGGGGGGGGGGPNRPKGPAELQFDPSLERSLSEIQRQGDEIGIRSGESRATLFNQTFDPNNPFSQQALLDRELKTQAAQTALGFGSKMGGLYQGAYEGVSGMQGFEGQQKQDTLLRGYSDALEEINRGELDTRGQLTRSADDLIWQTAIDQAADIEGTQAHYGKRRKKKGGGKGKGSGR